MMCHWYLVIVLQISVTLIDSNIGIIPVDSYQCKHDLVPHLPHTSNCHWPTETPDIASENCTSAWFNCTSQPNGVQWMLRNTSSSGRLDVTYPIMSNCSNIEYHVELLVAKDFDTVEKCKGAGLIQDSRLNFDFHSRRSLQIRKACGVSGGCHACQKRGVAKFQFVFTSCYMITVKLGKEISHSCPTFLNSTYERQPLTSVKPTFDPHFRDNKIAVSIHFPPLLCNLLKLDIKLMSNINTSQPNPCYSTGQKHSRCSLELNTSSDCVQRNGNKFTFTPKCSVVNDSSTITCVFANVDPGNHGIRLDIVDDDRCNTRGIWAKDERIQCHWCHVFTADHLQPSSSDVIETPGDFNRPYVIIAGILVGVIIVTITAICILFKMYRRKRPRPASSTSSVNRLPLQPASNIILLYARDCEPFMKLMQSFRQMLEDIVVTEVYDCYDPERAEEVSRNPIEWMRQLVTSRDMKIVVVASKCATLRQNAQQENQIVHYKVPTPFDDLFLYALQTINIYTTSDVYQRIFVVRFDEFSDDVDLLAHLNCYTRFVLPMHLDKLIDHLHQPSFSDQSLQLKTTGDLGNVRQDLTNLIQYRNENDNYLREILTLHRSL